MVDPGNVLGTECLGSFDFALRHLGGSLKATVVMGHTGCGAVGAAVDTYLSPNDYADIAFTHPLRSLVDRIMIAVRGAANAFDRRYGHSIHKHPDYRMALVEASAYLNAAITAFDLHRGGVVCDGAIRCTTACAISARCWCVVARYTASRMSPSCGLPLAMPMN